MPFFHVSTQLFPYCPEFFLLLYLSPSSSWLLQGSVSLRVNKGKLNKHFMALASGCCGWGLCCSQHCPFCCCFNYVCSALVLLMASFLPHFIFEEWQVHLSSKMRCLKDCNNSSRASRLFSFGYSLLQEPAQQANFAWKFWELFNAS